MFVFNINESNIACTNNIKESSDLLKNLEDYIHIPSNLDFTEQDIYNYIMLYQVSKNNSYRKTFSPVNLQFPVYVDLYDNIDKRYIISLIRFLNYLSSDILLHSLCAYIGIYRPTTIDYSNLSKELINIIYSYRLQFYNDTILEYMINLVSFEINQSSNVVLRNYCSETWILQQEYYEKCIKDIKNSTSITFNLLNNNIDYTYTLFDLKKKTCPVYHKDKVKLMYETQLCDILLDHVDKYVLTVLRYHVKCICCPFDHINIDELPETFNPYEFPDSNSIFNKNTSYRLIINRVLDDDEYKKISIMQQSEKDIAAIEYIYNIIIQDQLKSIFKSLL